LTEAWQIHGTSLPDGEPCAWWVGDGVLSAVPVTGAQWLPGRYVVPGLVDAHCHLTLVDGDAGPVPAPSDEVSRRLTELTRSGVLAVRDTGAHDDTAVVLARQDEAAVSVVACGRFLSSPGNYFPGVFEGVPADRLAGAAVEQVEAGATWVKLVADFPPGADLTKPAEPTYDLAAVQTMVDAVHAAGGRVAAHLTLPLVRDLIAAGIDSVEHGTALDEQTLDVMAARGIAWTPTLSAVLAPVGPDAPPDRVARQAERLERMRRLLPYAERVGVTVMAGSDVVGTVAGELANLAACGMSPTGALAAATTSARQFLGLPALVAGAPADLVTYDEDPRDDPSVLARPVAVVRRGRRVA
jgi:imidazolonepropionase-like amidohydrolase